MWGGEGGTDFLRGRMGKKYIYLSDKGFCLRITVGFTPLVVFHFYWLRKMHSPQTAKERRGQTSKSVF